MGLGCFFGVCVGFFFLGFFFRFFFFPLSHTANREKVHICLEQCRPHSRAFTEHVASLKCLSCERHVGLLRTVHTFAESMVLVSQSLSPAMSACRISSLQCITRCLHEVTSPRLRKPRSHRQYINTPFLACRLYFTAHIKTAHCFAFFFLLSLTPKNQLVELRFTHFTSAKKSKFFLSHTDADDDKRHSCQTSPSIPYAINQRELHTDIRFKLHSTSVEMGTGGWGGLARPKCLQEFLPDTEAACTRADRPLYKCQAPVGKLSSESCWLNFQGLACAQRPPSTHLTCTHLNQHDKKALDLCDAEL